MVIFGGEERKVVVPVTRLMGDWVVPAEQSRFEGERPAQLRGEREPV